MDDAGRHYEEVLAEHYTWMVGMPYSDKVAEQFALLAKLGVRPQTTDVALDLGSGPGYQSIALAKLGFSRVLAIDTSQALLDELAAEKGDQPIEPVRADLRALPKLVAPNGADAIVCMGDTLTHLGHRAEVSALFASAYIALAPGGIFVLSFRDLSVELSGLDRFLLVRADADRIMTCVLEYEPHSVVVTDLIHTRDGETWTLRKSSYRKLRLSPPDMATELREAGFAIRHQQPIGRLFVIAATKN